MQRSLRAPWATLAALGLAGALAASPTSWAAAPADLLTGYRVAAGNAAVVPDRGRQLFTATHGREWSCASCHGAAPTRPGRHAGTGKTIAALAPAFNPDRFSDPARVEKWFRRNCNDVMGRECTAAEKADVLAWLMSLKP